MNVVFALHRFIDTKWEKSRDQVGALAARYGYTVLEVTPLHRRHPEVDPWRLNVKVNDEGRIVGYSVG